MARRGSQHPTELELQILKVLWRESPLPVREVRRALASRPPGRELAHSSVITILNIMVRKKYLQRTKQGNAYVFRPSVTEKEVGQRMLRDLVDRVFDGSAMTVVLQLLETADVDTDELRKIRQLINRKAREQSE